MADDDGSFQVEWQAVLRDGDNYVRQELVLRALKKDMPLTEVVLIELPVEKTPTVGAVLGSPVAAGNLFFACESPLADNRGQPGRVRCALPWKTVLKAGDTLRSASVVGVAPADQMRRAFLYYVERKRARPYQPFLHYNSWYDIAWSDRKFDEKESLAVIEQFGRELVEKRGVKIDSFVFDDGWDDNRTLWGFHAGFPQGFTPLKDAAAKYGSAIGVWLSPWGGYADAKKQRLQYGREQGFEINSKSNGFSLAGPKYYARFRQICLDMIDKYGVNCFKFDGVGVGGALARAASVPAMALALPRPSNWPTPRPSCGSRRSCTRPGRDCTSTTPRALGPRPSGSGTAIPSGAAAKTADFPAKASCGNSGSTTATRRRSRTSFAAPRCSRSTR